jgi:peptide/nickel transport system substrate-binding protein
MADSNMPSGSAGDTRRDVLKKMSGAAGTAAIASLAGCGGGGGGGGGNLPDDDPRAEYVNPDLSEERKIRDLRFLVQVEGYFPSRYATNDLIRENVNSALGTNIVLEALQETPRFELERQNKYDLMQYGWWAEFGGDPNPGIAWLYHSEGQRNFGRYNNPDYDEVIENNWETYDLDERQDYLYEAQEMIMEQRWANPYLHLELIHPYNTNVVDPDSVVEDYREQGSWVTWFNLEPAEENEDNVVVTNNNSPTNMINPYGNDTMSPARNFSPVEMMMDQLVKFDQDYNRVNWIAEEIIQEDSTTIRVPIRDDFVFHDGEPLTAEDVKYTYDLAIRTEPTLWKQNVTQYLESVDQTGDYEVVFNLSETFSPFTTAGFWSSPIVPKHFWQRVLEEEGAEDEPWQVGFQNRKMIGSGPFQYDTWNLDEEFVMTPFEDHPIVVPNVTRIQRPLDSTGAELQALIDGQYGYMDYWFGDNQQMQQALDEHDYLEAYQGPNNRTEQLMFQVGSRTEDGYGGPPTSDQAFRHAVSVIVSRTQQTFINEVYDGFGLETNTVIPPTVGFWHNDEWDVWDRGSNEKAVDILAEAGYEWDENGDLYHPEDAAHL